MYEQILGAVANQMGGSGGGGGGSAVPGRTGASTGAVSTVIAPQGINLGAILQPLNEGNSATGGYDINLLSRLGYGTGGGGPVYSAAGPGFNLDFDMSNPSTWLMIGGALIGVLLIAKKGR